jgi:uncharacterized protein with von Willebrand factor type A (vWA) domain
MRACLQIVQMPKNLNVQLFNRVCELNYKAKPVKEMTCGQFIRACQKQFEEQANSSYGGKKTVEIMREVCKHVPESMFKASGIEIGSSEFGELLQGSSPSAVRGVATISIGIVRASLPK